MRLNPRDGLGAALQFISVFPEAQCFNVTLLTEEKRFVVHEATCTRSKLLKELKNWLSIGSVHFFIRPLLSNVVLLDLDEYQGGFDVLLKLKPRISQLTLSTFDAV